MIWNSPAPLITPTEKENNEIHTAKKNNTYYRTWNILFSEKGNKWYAKTDAYA